MRKLVVAAVAGIVLLGGIAVLVIVLATGSAGFTTGPLGIAQAPSGAATSAPLPALPGSQALLRAPEPPPPPLIMGPPRPTPPEGSWEAVTPVARPAAAGPVGAAVGRELNELHDKISLCFDEDVQARHGQVGLTTVKDYAPLEDRGTTILMLEVEAGYGEARIVDAPVETRGGASDGLIGCAQRVLRGHVVQTAEAKGPGRYRILFPLLP